MPDYSVWLEPEPDGLHAIQYIAGRRAIDEMSTDEELCFRAGVLRHRADEFAARSVFEFVMEVECQ